MVLHRECHNLFGWVLDKYFIVAPTLMSFYSQSDVFNPCLSFEYEKLFFSMGFLFMLPALTGRSWNAVSHILCAIIALRQIQISARDIAQSNMLLFIRIGVWQQIIPVPLFPSFKVIGIEFTNPHSGVSAHALHFLQSGSTLLKGKDEGEKRDLLWVWLHTTVIHICRCSEWSFIFITHQKL